MAPTSGSPATQIREILAATRLEHVRYAIRDIAVLAEEVVRQGHEILPLNIGDPCQFDFETPPALIEAVARAMRDAVAFDARVTGVPSTKGVL